MTPVAARKARDVRAPARDRQREQRPDAGDERHVREHVPRERAGRDQLGHRHPPIEIAATPT
jgi:hypothetical protein